MTLDDDVAAKLRNEVKRSGRPFKQVVNDFLRAGLNVRKASRPSGKFTIDGKPMGLRPGVDIDNIGELMEQIDGPHRK